jgi:DDE superfamily endonuclease
MVPAHLRKRETYPDLAVGFGIGTTTAYRYLREALTVLVALKPAAKVTTYAVSDYSGLDPQVRAPYRRVRYDRATGKFTSSTLSAGQKAASRTHASTAVDAAQAVIING